MTFRYIGSKSRLVEQIKARIGPPTRGFFVDAFCGMGAVARAAAELGWPVRINDHLYSAVVASAARLISVKDATFTKLGGYDNALQTLNAAAPLEGFIWRSYSPPSVHYCGIERRYFTAENALRIDAIRAMIREWRASGTITATEERLLIADLFSALNRVANIAGTFGCFLSKWTPQALNPLIMRPRKLNASPSIVETSVGDVFDARVDADDVVYLDPPYTKRQYSSYYHILETVALGDEPVVVGVAGLRPWRDRASDFCYKTRARDTLFRLIDGLASRRVLLSYSSQGHIALTDLREALSLLGTSTIYPLGNIGRYRPNKAASDGGSDVSEYLVVITRAAPRRALRTPPTRLQATPA